MRRGERGYSQFSRMRSFAITFKMFCAFTPPPANRDRNGGVERRGEQMRNRTGLAILVLVGLSAFGVWTVCGRALGEKVPAEQTISDKALEGLAALEPIDVHTHVFKK